MTYNSERLDRVEAILDRLAERQNQHEHEMAERQNRHEREMTERQNRHEREMTERQNRHEHEMTQRQERSDREIAAIQAITESNARAIEANSHAMAEMRREMQETTAAADQQLREAINDTVAMITDLARQQYDTDQRFTIFLEDARADRQRMDQTMADLARQQQDIDQRFTIFLEDARADRLRSEERSAANDTEHRAFQQITQTLLAEISRIWQRLAS